ncbi:SusC/RagA family TonB-linked outer membrane protein [Pedobacter sp. JY14-1]|uniref:SusC/RagA family TonB-linked outer membrane protein n=1 Tax=Pedobacter sp. JY14-1 TaxID=3034151 RepID=UPI0023E10BD2|nr:SusC/RagA family TonB-linked outer membrane protein [Pedobacter sp. JY14-1]
MKLTTFILMLALAQVSAAGFGQTVTLNEKNTPIEKVLLKIRQQSGYEFIYDVKDLKRQKVSLKLTNASIEEAVKGSLEDLPITYTILDKNIVLKKKEASFIDNIIARFRAIDVRGRILDENNQPLAGATISVKGKEQQAKTDAQGNFYLQNVDEKATLVISFIGYKTREILAKEDLGILLLKLEDNSLDQVQVIAYGKVQAKYTTSNIVSIPGEKLAQQPLSNILLAAQGRVPGLFIQPQNGLNTGTIDVTVQGRNSLNNGNQPFYVIDGVPFTPNSLLAQSGIAGSITSGAGMSNLSFLNPSEIESITVLKDADATAIYGSRAANGAILITTKKGKAGKTKVDLNLQSGWGKVANRVKVLNTDQYIAIKKEAYANNNNQPIPASAIDINGTWDPKRSVNWQEELAGETAQFQNFQGSLSGGSDRTQFLAGVGYIRETPVFKGNFSNVKTSVNFNVNHSSVDQKFRFFLSASYLEGNNQLPTEDITGRALTMAPNAPDLYNSDGTINWAPVPNVRPFQSIDPNPAASLLKRYTNKASNLVANSSLGYEIMPGLIIKSTFGYNNLRNDEVSIAPFESLLPEDRFYGQKPFATFGDRRIKSWIIEPQATYTRTFSFGTFDALLGSTFQSTDNYALTLRGSDYSNDLQLTDFNAAGAKTTSASLQSTYKYSAVFGRFNYRVKDRYILNLTARRDGSSRFGSRNLFHNFYSAGGAWIFTEEDIVKQFAPIVNFGKLRASYGTTGNDQIGDYTFYTLYNSMGNITAPYLGVAPLAPGGLPNPYLEWEETKKLNFGIDIGLWESKIVATANYFRNRSSNQLLNQSLSIVTGPGFITRNLPAIVQNTGWEFNLQYEPVKRKDFHWQGSVNITLPKNKLIRYDNLDKSNDRNNYVIGQPINVIRLYSFVGVNQQTGIYDFRNAKGEVTSAPSESTDRNIFLTTDPKWYGGFNNSFSYKGINLDLFFNFVSQWAANLKYQAFPYSQFNSNYTVSVLDHWKNPGDNKPIQMVSSNFGKVLGPYNAAKASDAAYDKVTYARLNNATLSYNFSSELTRRIHISNARLYVQGQNLFMITNFKNGDPGVPSTANIGLMRMYTVGTQITF